MLQSSTLKFLRDLKKNNNKSWFDANRSAYENARNDFAEFIQKVIDKFGKKDQTISKLKAKDTMFRINRDIRFSKDKSPYKTNFGAGINKGGRKSMSSAGYYFHLEPGNNSFVGGGLYMPMPEELKKVRQEIDYNLADFKKILNSKKFKAIYSDLDKSEAFMLSRVPKGYDPLNPAAEWLRLKSHIAFINLTDKEITDKGLINKTISSFEALQPLNEFLNRAIE